MYVAAGLPALLRAISAISPFAELVRPVTLPAIIVGISSGVVAGFVAAETTSFTSALGNGLLGALAFAFLNAGSNCLNQYCDRASDAIDKPQRPLPSGRLSGASVLSFASVCYVIAVLFAILVRPAAWRWAFDSLFVLAVILTVIYSVPPIRTKRRWWVALPTIALARGLVLFAAGWSISAPLTFPDPWILGSTLTLFLLGAAATKDWSDLRGDAATDCRTLPLLYGSRGAALRIAPFFVAPWFALIITGKLLQADPIALAVVGVALMVWGAMAVRILLNCRPDQLTLGKNHHAWVHMYAMLIAAHFGIATAYLSR